MMMMYGCVFRRSFPSRVGEAWRDCRHLRRYWTTRLLAACSSSVCRANIHSTYTFTWMKVVAAEWIIMHSAWSGIRHNEDCRILSTVSSKFDLWSICSSCLTLIPPPSVFDKAENKILSFLQSYPAVWLCRHLSTLTNQLLFHQFFSNLHLIWCKMFAHWVWRQGAAQNL